MTLGDRLRALRNAKGLKQPQLAKLAKVGQSTISDLENNKKGTSADGLARIANVLETTSDYLLGRVSQNGQTQIQKINDGFVDAGRINSEKRWVPVKAYSKMGPDGFYTDMGYPGNGGDGYVPTSNAGPNAFAVKGSGGSMHPAIRDGWYCVCDPDAPAVHGEYVQVCLRDGRCTIKEFISLQNDLLTLLAVNSGERWTFDLVDVECIIGITDIVPPSRHKQEYPDMPVYEIEHQF